MVAARRIILLKKVDLRAVTAIASGDGYCDNKEPYYGYDGGDCWKIKIMKVVVQGVC